MPKIAFCRPLFACLLLMAQTISIGALDMTAFNVAFQNFFQSLSPAQQRAFKVIDARQGHKREENIKLFHDFVNELPREQKIAGQNIIDQMNEGARQWWQMVVEPQPASVKAAFEKAKQILDSDISAQQVCAQLVQLKRELSPGDLRLIGNVWQDNIECSTVKRVVPHPIMQLNMNIEQQNTITRHNSYKCVNLANGPLFNFRKPLKFKISLKL